MYVLHKWTEREREKGGKREEKKEAGEWDSFMEEQRILQSSRQVERKPTKVRALQHIYKGG